VPSNSESTSDWRRTDFSEIHTRVPASRWIRFRIGRFGCGAETDATGFELALMDLVARTATGVPGWSFGTCRAVAASVVVPESGALGS